MSRHTFCLGLLSVVLAGCSDDTSDPVVEDAAGESTGGTPIATGGSANAGAATGGAAASATGGTGGTANASSSTGGAPDGTAGGAPGSQLRGAVSLNILGEGCTLPDQFVDLPLIATGHPVTATEYSELVTDGETAEGGANVAVTCTWRETIMTGVVSIGVGVNRKRVSLDSTTVVGETSQGGVNIISPGWPSSYGSSPESPCVYAPIEVDQATKSIWGEFSCGILDNEDGTDRCVLGPSYFYFENCSDP